MQAGRLSSEVVLCSRPGEHTSVKTDHMGAMRERVVQCRFGTDVHSNMCGKFD